MNLLQSIENHQNRMKYRDIALQIKAEDVGPTGSFVGYASIFGQKDSYGDIVMPGAFTKSLQAWQKQGNLPALLFAHKTDQPVGVHDGMVEDSKGLLVEGRLAIDGVARAKELHVLLKMGGLRGMSIGYMCDDYETDRKEGTTSLKTIDLWENSLVTFPSCPGAGVTGVKNSAEPGTLPSDEEFLEYLREAGFSKEDALVVARKGYSALLAQYQAPSIKSTLADIFSNRYGAKTA